MITCSQATEMMAKKEEGKISLIDRIRLWYHLFICILCRLYKKQDALIVKHLHTLDKKAPDVSLSEKEKNEMIEKLKKDSGDND